MAVLRSFLHPRPSEPAAAKILFQARVPLRRRSGEAKAPAQIIMPAAGMIQRFPFVFFLFYSK
jgi:hypothetical protein